MTQIQGIESINEIGLAANQLTPGLKWWRGQPMDMPLVPSAFRSTSTLAEFNYLNHFRRSAAARYANAPGYEDLADWLALAQHYGLPTRLLDWSESLATALYFAAEKCDEQDGVLWILSPFRLNRAHVGLEAVGLLGSDRTTNLVKDAFTDEPDKATESVLATYPHQRDVRHIVQQTVFTIHPNRNSLESMTNSDQWMTKMVVPAACKLKIRRQLGAMGVHRASLFPDLENLAHRIKELKPISGTPYDKTI